MQHRAHLFLIGHVAHSRRAHPLVSFTRSYASCWCSVFTTLFFSPRFSDGTTTCLVTLLHFNGQIVWSADDYCEYALGAMTTLKENGRSNILYRLARALFTKRSDGTGSKFPADRMPMGLLEYIVGFFDSNTSPQVGVYCL